MTEYPCPNCGQPIYDDEATLCLYCGEALMRPSGFMGEVKYGTPRGLIIAIAILAVVSFAILVLRS